VSHKQNKYRLCDKTIAVKTVSLGCIKTISF